MEASGRSSWQSRNSGKTYIAIGMLQDLKIIMTKKGKQMAFAKLADYKGFIDVTFFPPVWEKYSSRIEAEKVYAKGNVKHPYSA